MSEVLTDDAWSPVLGYLHGWDIFPFHQMLVDPTRENVVNGLIASGAGGIVLVGAIAAPILLTAKRWWRPLWSDWLTSLDHKRIGIMYVVLALVMLSRALIEAVLMRAQQAVAIDAGGFLSPEHFAELFTTHGTIMIFFVAMPLLTGLINYVVPLQIGARDVSFPLLNSVGLGLTASGAGLVMVSLVLGTFSTGGWTGYPPYTGLAYSPGVGPDYWIWALSLAGIGTTLTGMNIAVTIYKERAPGMTFMRMPLFCWTSLCVSILIVFALPPLTAATAMLALDRYLDFHLFTNDLGGNVMNYANLFWLFGHPEVYILVLPAFGVYSELFSTFSGKKLYGYGALVTATMSIAVLSFTVWLHHFFTMGQSASVNAAFGIATMLIGIPTGVKIYDWLLTMYRGRVRITVPMIYALGFLPLFAVGGATGIMLANPSLDYVTHNTLFLVAHFHNTLVPGVLFGMLAGLNYWWPKAFGYRLDERWGRISALAWVFGFMLAFFPLYALGLLGMPRRSVAFAEPAYVPWAAIALVGAFVLLFALCALFVQLWVSVRGREGRRVAAGDPWDGRSLEWSVASPPPEWNFAILPAVQDRDDFMRAKEAGTAYAAPAAYEDIELPRNSAIGPVIAVLGFGIGFAAVWHIWWLAIGGCAVVLATMVARGFVRETHRTVAAAEVRAATERWLATVAATPQVTRAAEESSENAGLAVPATSGAVR